MMPTMLDGSLLAAALVLCVPVLVLCVECVAALACAAATARGDGARREDAARLSSPKSSGAPAGAGATETVARAAVTVLVPAHDEQGQIATLLESLRPQLTSPDRIVVIADNCTDDTAAVARGCGAEVIERREPTLRGKGHALNFGVRHLEHDDRPVVIMLDADCVAHVGLVDALAAQVARDGRPAQAVYLMTCAPDASAGQRISALAFAVKNLVRPMGLRRLGLPCLLTGSGMAFPREVIRRAQLDGGSIVEDMELGLRLTEAGEAPRLCVDARVTSPLSRHRAAASSSQRRRWEHGHLRMLLAHAPRLLWLGVRRRSLEMTATALELSVPPLSLMMMTLVSALAAATIAARFAHASWVPAAMIGGMIVLTLACVTVAWWRFARQTFPASAAAGVPMYVLRKVPLYVAFLYRRQREWVRADRATPMPTTTTTTTTATNTSSAMSTTPPTSADRPSAVELNVNVSASSPAHAGVAAATLAPAATQPPVPALAPQ